MLQLIDLKFDRVIGHDLTLLWKLVPVSLSVCEHFRLCNLM